MILYLLTTYIHILFDISCIYFYSCIIYDYEYLSDGANGTKNSAKFVTTRLTKSYPKYFTY